MTTTAHGRGHSNEEADNMSELQRRIGALKNTLGHIQTAGSYLESTEFNHPINEELCEIIHKLQTEIAYLEKQNRESEV